jgi:hypothetical protein
VQVDIRQQGANYSPNNVAKIVIEFLITIPRERLRPNYRDGFRGAPLDTSLPDLGLAGRNRGGKRDVSETKAKQPDHKGEADV